MCVPRVHTFAFLLPLCLRIFAVCVCAAHTSMCAARRWLRGAGAEGFLSGLDAGKHFLAGGCVFVSPLRHLLVDSALCLVGFTD